MECAREPSSDIRVPEAWRRVADADLPPTVVVIGRTDRGKSTLVRWLAREWALRGHRVGWVDADVGQSVLGLPATQNLALLDGGPGAEPRVVASFFVGAVSPRGYMLPCVVGVRRLADRARALGCDRILVDTTGLVAPSEGGVALKTWKVELLAPAAVIALERDGELTPILAPMEADPRVRVHRLEPAGAVRARSAEERAERRARLFRTYLAAGTHREVGRRGLALYGIGRIRSGRIVGFLDAEGWCVGLGTVTHATPDALRVLTPADPDRAVALRLGAVHLDPETGRELG